MHTDISSSSARIKKKKKRHDKGADEGEWKQFTSPEGHPYFYNSVTKESRWELPTESELPLRSKHRRPKGSSREVVLEEESGAGLEQTPAIISNKELNEDPDGSVTVEKQEPKNLQKPKNAIFQKLQASLEGRFSAMNGHMNGMGRPSPMLNIRRGKDEYEVDDTETETKTLSLEDQFENETAGMSAAERLRFLRKKRQENMMTKRESVVGDDFMAEVANNMKKKMTTQNPKSASDKVLSWKEKEQAEEERKQQQLQEEAEAKEEEEVRKEREQQAANERELSREQERAEQLALEERREQERKQQQEEERGQRQVKQVEKQKNRKKKNEESTRADEIEEGSSEHDVDNSNKAGDVEPALRDQLSQAALDDSADMSSPERVKNRKQHRSRERSGDAVEDKKAKSGVSTEIEQVGQRPVSGADDGAVQDEKQRARIKKRERKLREKELSALSSRASVTPESPRQKLKPCEDGQNEEFTTRSANTIENEEVRAREKLLRRERKRMAKVEAALAAQNISNSGGQSNEQERNDRSGSLENVKDEHGNNSSNGNGFGGSMNGQLHPAQFSGGMYSPYPYMMMPPPPPQPPMMPYGYYNPYIQPPPSLPMYPPGMFGAPPGYQFTAPTPPPSLGGVGAPSAMVPYSADSTLVPYSSMCGQQQPSELTRCECCRGIGVGLVEKNGVCAHCNRLRLAFIVDSVQLRQRCSVCGGWGFQLLQANGMCEHCTRQNTRKLQRKPVMKDTARRRSKLAAPLAAPVPILSSSRRNSTATSKNDGLDDVDWDKSSSESDWDD